MQGTPMPIQCRLNVLLAEYNLRRAQESKKPVSIRHLARETKIPHSSLVSLVNNQVVRFDARTLEKLMRFFGTNDLNDILVYVPEQGKNEL